MDSAKEHFKTSPTLEASNWMQSLLREFGYKRGKNFWKVYNRLYKKNTGNIGPIQGLQLIAYRCNCNCNGSSKVANCNCAFPEASNCNCNRF